MCHDDGLSCHVCGTRSLSRNAPRDGADHFYRVRVGATLYAPIFDLGAALESANVRGGEVETWWMSKMDPHMTKAEYVTEGDRDILTDRCGDCGLDMREPIHATHATSPLVGVNDVVRAYAPAPSPSTPSGPPTPPRETVARVAASHGSDDAGGPTPSPSAATKGGYVAALEGALHSFVDGAPEHCCANGAACPVCHAKSVLKGGQPLSTPIPGLLDASPAPTVSAGPLPPSPSASTASAAAGLAPAKGDGGEGVPKEINEAIYDYGGACVYDHGGATAAAADEKNAAARQVAIDALRAAILSAIKAAEGRGETKAPPVGAVALCPVCAREEPWGTWGPHGIVACVRCRDAGQKAASEVYR
jgi:hypothetical protein